MDRSRRLRITGLAIATGLLALATWSALQAVGRLGQAQSRAAMARAELTQLRGLLPAIEQHEQYVRDGEDIRVMIGKAGFDPARWANRKLQRTAALLPRRDAEALLLQQIGANGAQWFAADYFDVSVASAGAGLFSPSAPDDRGFNVEMAGVLYFPLVGK